MKNKYNYERSSKSIISKIIITIISIIVLAGQLFLIYLVFFKAKEISWISILIRVIGLLCVLYLVNSSMSSSYKQMWTIIILVFPFAGTIFYLMAGNQRSFPKWRTRKINKFLLQYELDSELYNQIRSFNPIAYKHISIIKNATNAVPYTNTDVEFYENIDSKHQAMLNDLRNAKKYIFMEYFILSDGKMLNSIIEVLEEVAQKGVEIRICYDDFGCKLCLHKNTFERLLRIKNIKIVKFAPLGLNLNLTVNYRDHRKLTIIDGNIAYLGGDNIADEYANYITRFGYWRDNAVKLTGDAVRGCLFTFAETWFMSTKEKLDINKYQPDIKVDNLNSIVMPFGDGPTDKNNPAYDVYMSLINNAKDYLYLSTPYFIIDNEFIKAVVNACKSGIDVKILIPGIPDKKIIYLITKSHLGQIIKAGGKVYLYSNGFNHAKNMICDDQYAIIGSINFDYRSLYLHFENGVLLMNEEVVKTMKQDFLNALASNEELSLTKWKKQSIFSKLFTYILKFFSPLM